MTSYLTYYCHFWRKDIYICRRNFIANLFKTKNPFAGGLPLRYTPQLITSFVFHERIPNYDVIHLTIHPLKGRIHNEWHRRIFFYIFDWRKEIHILHHMVHLEECCSVHDCSDGRGSIRKLTSDSQLIPRWRWWTQYLFNLSVGTITKVSCATVLQ